MIQGSRGARAFFSASGIVTRLIARASGFQPVPSRQRARGSFLFALRRKVRNDPIYELEPGQTVVLRDFKHWSAGLVTDSGERLARISGALQLGTSQRGKMVEILLAQTRAVSIGESGNVVGAELCGRHTIKQHGRRREIDVPQLCVSLDCLGNRETVGGRNLDNRTAAPIADHLRDVA